MLPTPEQVDELRKVIKPMIPYAINLWQGLQAANPLLVEDSIINLVLIAAKAELLN
jgi:hypothetical protein